MVDIKEYLNRSIRHSRHEETWHDEDKNTTETVTAKAVTMGCLFAVSFICGSLPIKLSQWFNWETGVKGRRVVMMLLRFGGGVLMCTTFLHLFPETTEHIDYLTEEEVLPESPLHFAPLLMCIGFFTMYFIEECVHVYIHMRKHKQEMDKLENTLSVRRGEVDISEEVDSKEISSNLTKNDGETGETCSKGNNQGHFGHSHLIVEQDDTVVLAIRGLLIVLALSVHELFEGLAVGLQSSAATVWYMFGAVAAHKFVIAFCIGVELVTSKTRATLIVIYIFTFAVVSPLGIGIGIIISADDADSTTVVSVILQALATGTLLYVVFFEILQKDKIKGLEAYFAIFIGFAAMLGLTAIIGHDHCHHHHHGHNHDDDHHHHHHHHDSTY